MIYVLAYIGAMVLVFFLIQLYGRFALMEQRIAQLGPITYHAKD